MKKFLIGIYFLFAPFVNAQTGVDNFWLMGVHGTGNTPINIDFMSGTPNVYATTRSMNFERSVGEISDTSGNLLFYTNGCYVANSLNNEMYNGDSLNPGTCTNNVCSSAGGVIQDGDIVLPAPGYKDRYYLFHETCDYNSPGARPTELFYTIIDMSQQGGLGAVILKNQIIIDNDFLNVGFLSACKHANGRDWWIVVHNMNNLFYTLLLTPEGIQGPFMQALDPAVGWVSGNSRDAAGQTEFSPDGTKLATSTWWTHYTIAVIPDLHLFDFDRCTGLFSNHKLLYSNAFNFPGGGGGLSFSPNSRFLYLATLDTILQFDITAPDIAASQTPVGVYDDTTTGFWFSQLAYDDKIYIVDGTNLELHSFTTIHSPNSPGLSCNVQLHNIQLPNGCFQTLPNYPNYRLGALTGSGCDSLTSVNEENDFHLKLSVYPNPSAEGVFHFQFNNTREKIKELEVTDITGRVVYSVHKPTFEINISFATSGIYFYSAQTSSGKFFNGKLIKK